MIISHSLYFNNPKLLMWNGGFYNKHNEHIENVYESARNSVIILKNKQDIHRRIYIIHKRLYTLFI